VPVGAKERPGEAWLWVDPTRNDPGWFTRERLLTLTLLLSTLLALWVCYLLVQPFIPAVAIAIALAVATKRPHDWLRQRYGSATSVAALGVFLVACLIVVPLTVIMTVVVRQILANVQQLHDGGGGLPDWRNALYLPPVFGSMLDWAETNLDLRAQLTRLWQGLLGRVGILLAGSVNLITQLAIMLFVLFFLYRDRDRALDALRGLLPLSVEESNRMLGRIEDSIVATVNGSLTVAFSQAFLAGVMYTALDVPASLVWAAVTFLFALIPVFGTFMVWGPIAVFLLISGSWIKAVILIAWGVLVVASIDNVLYPYLVGDRLRLHTIPTFFAILGGIGLFGPSGLILGPVSLAVTLGLLHVWWWRTADGRTAEQAVPVAERVPPVQAV
jgi:predicted PurR-regulated permease PerM